jgi:hypothetical protein
VPRRLRPLLELAARHLFAVVQPPPKAPPEGAPGLPAAKRQAGVFEAKRKLIHDCLKAAGVDLAAREMELPACDPADEVMEGQSSDQAGGAAVDVAAAAAAAAGGAAAKQQQEAVPGPQRVAAWAAEIAAWAGAGAPLPPSDPALIVCFISIPGSGKTSLLQGLGGRVPGADGPASLVVMNSDVMKRTINGFISTRCVWRRAAFASVRPHRLTCMPAWLREAHTPRTHLAPKHPRLDCSTPRNSPPPVPTRYWSEVAAAADTYVGGGHTTVVVADKNLVPAPLLVLPNVAGTLNASGAPPRGL